MVCNVLPSPCSSAFRMPGSPAFHDSICHARLSSWCGFSAVLIAGGTIAGCPVGRGGCDGRQRTSSKLSAVSRTSLHPVHQLLEHRLLLLAEPFSCARQFDRPRPEGSHSSQNGPHLRPRRSCAGQDRICHLIPEALKLIKSHLVEQLQHGFGEHLRHPGRAAPLKCVHEVSGVDRRSSHPFREAHELGCFHEHGTGGRPRSSPLAPRARAQRSLYPFA